MNGTETRHLLRRRPLRLVFVAGQLLACGTSGTGSATDVDAPTGQPPAAGASAGGVSGSAAGQSPGVSGVGGVGASSGVTGSAGSGGSGTAVAGSSSGAAGSGGSSGACAPPPSGPVPAGYDSHPISAFPGAEGFGAWSRGGRGGDVYRVTTLAPSGPGSLLHAVDTTPANGRTIVFAVSGHIALPNNAKIKKYTTIAGQTAPGGGIVVTNRGLWAGDHDIVIRHVRMRVGVGGGGDSMDSTGAAANLMLDHCEYMFSKDENFSNFGAGTPNLTDQWAINAWGLQPHSAGGLWAMKHVTSHHSLWANNHTRNPKVITPDVFDWVNNLTFGWDIGMNLSGADAGGQYRANVRGSTFFHGGSAKEAIFGGGGPVGSNVLGYTAFFSDSAFDGAADGVFSAARGEGELFAAGQEGNVNRASVAFSQTLDGSPEGEPLGVPVTVDDRVTAFKKIVSQAGALRLDVAAPALRDEVSQKAIDGAVAGKRQIISDPSELGLTNGEAKLWPGAAAADQDADGMPDFWEQALGFDAARASHNDPLSCAEIGVSFFPAGTPEGYTHLDEYLHFLAVPHAVLTADAAPPSITVDLRRYTAGFLTAPVFTLNDVRGGAASQAGPGGALLSFRPAPGLVGRAGLEFTVVDADGSSWKQQLAVLVRAPAAP